MQDAKIDAGMSKEAAAQHLDTKARMIIGVLFVLYGGAIVYFVNRYVYNWPHWDDFLLIEFYDQIFLSHTFGWTDFFTLRDGSQPEGVVAVLSAFIFRFTGINFTLLVWLNVALIFGAAVVIAATASRHLSKPLSKGIVWIALPAVMCHPFQIEQLIWASSIGWFLTSAILLVNISIVESESRFKIPLLLVTLFVVTFSSAAGNLLWIIAAIHLVLRYKKEFAAWAFVFGITGIVSCVRLAMLPATHASCTELQKFHPFSSFQNFIAYLGEFTRYFVQISGTAFSQRDPSTLLFLGVATLSIAAAALLLMLRRRTLTSVDRMGVMLIITSLGFLAMFTFGRLPCGLAAMTWEFHMSPVVTPLLAGLVLIGAQIYDDDKRANPQLSMLGMLVPVLYVFFSILISLPDFLMRAQILQLVRVVGKHSVCTPDTSRYVIENANLATGSYDEIMEDAKLISHLCDQAEPSRAGFLENLPPLYKKMIAADPAAATPLRDIWDVYSVRIDLLRAFPIGASQTPKNLLRWIRAQAVANSVPEGEKLAGHADYFKNLKLD